MAGTNVVIENVNSNEMRNLAGQVEGKIDQWDQAVANLYTLVQEMDGMWDGDANQKFNERWQNEDKPKYNRLSEVMKDFRKAIVDAANAYDAAEDEAKTTVSRASS